MAEIRRALLSSSIALVAAVLGCGPDQASDARWSDLGCSLEDAVHPSTESDEFRYREAARTGQSDSVWFENLGGLHWYDGTLFILDAGRGTVFRFADGLVLDGSFARSGQGPGELETVSRGVAFDGGRRRWIAGIEETVVVFDGRRLHEFSETGEYKSSRTTSPTGGGLSHLSSRFAFTDGGLVFGWGGHNPMLAGEVDAASPRYELRVMRENGEPGHLLHVVMPPVPHFRGAPYVGAAEARPVWDVWRRCVVLSDGHNPWLLVQRPNETDTVPIPIPDAPHPVGDRGEAELMGQARGTPPPPAAPARLQDLIIDPRGVIWIQTARRRISTGEVEVLRVPMTGGAAAFDTVPAFPRAFGADGTYFATVRDDLDRVVVVQYDPIQRD